LGSAAAVPEELEATEVLESWPRRPARRASPTIQVISTTITIISLAMLGFAGYVGFASRLHHDRAQLVAYADFRKDLANATAPVGQTKPTDASKLLDLGTPVAVLTIPKLHLNEVVFEGTTAAVLESGPGHLRSTPLPGQAGVSEIMGRSNTYGGPFRRLATLVPDDTFTVTTGQGVAHYKVLDVRRNGFPQPPPPASGAGRLLLATAYGTPFDPTDVLRVDADQTSAVQPGSRLVLSASELSPAEHALAIDVNAWFPLVLIGEALVLCVAFVSWARTFWGAWQAWIIAVPLIGFFGVLTADQAARLLPNLM
jgi:sortase (surface protein transpeptidase)